MPPDDTKSQAAANEDIIAQKLINIGFRIVIDEKRLNADLNPTLAALSKKLNTLSDNSKITSGIFGKDFFKEKIKGLTGFDFTLLQATKSIVKYGLASKDTTADNKEFYNSLSPLGKALSNVASAWSRRKEAEKVAASQSKDTKIKLNDLGETLDEVSQLEGMLANNGNLEASMGALGSEATGAAKGVEGIIPAAEGAAGALETLGVVASAGLALLLLGIVAITRGLYLMFTQAMTARAEFKKFDQLFGGVGSKGVAEGIQQLKGLNRELWGLGLSLEKVNEVAFEATSSGLNFSRAIKGDFVSSILTLSGATGVAASEINGLYTELLKTTPMALESITQLGDGFISFNRIAKASGNLGQISFSMFREGITSSANALGIAAARGKEFTDRMTKDLTALTGLASTLSLSISDLNNKFEEAGNLVNSPDSGFRTLLTLSGGANINQMLTGQFDKTDAMIKGIRYLQQFNKSLGGNLQISAQIIQQQLGVSKEIAIKMVNTNEKTINDMLNAQREMSSMQTGAAKDAYESVNSGIMDQWARMKTMFTTFFQNAFGGSQGMIGLVQRVEGMLTRLRGYMENAGWIKKLETAIDTMANWIGDKLAPVLDWIGEKLDDFTNPNKNILKSIGNAIVDVLKAGAFLIGKIIGAGIRAAMPWYFSSFGEKYDDSDNTSVIKKAAGMDISPYQEQISKNRTREAEISKQQNQSDQYAPDTLTFGKMADGTIGFETIAQKQFALEEEKKKLEADDRQLQKEMKTLLATIADNTSPTKQAAKQTTNSTTSGIQSDNPLSSHGSGVWGARPQV